MSANLFVRGNLTGSSMPLTPFHLGPVLLLGLLIFSYVDLPALSVGAVAPDLEGLFDILFDPPRRDHHEFLHSYLGAFLLAFPVASFAYVIRGVTGSLAHIFGLRQNSSPRVILFSSILGTFSHVFLDSFLYQDQDPFMPFDGNPFFPILGERQYIIIYLGCSLCFLLGIAIWLRRPGWMGPGKGS